MSPDREKKVTDTLGDILSSREFTEPENKITIADRIADMIKDFIKWILELLPDRKTEGDSRLDPQYTPPGALALKVLAIVLIFALVFFLVFFIFRNLRSSKSVKKKEDAELLTILKDYEEVERMALEFYSKGDIRQAIRFLYMALLLKLNEINIVRIDKSKTNKQYLREAFESQYSFYSEMKEFTHDFNRYWYGRNSVDNYKFDYWYSVYTSRLKEGSR